MEPKNYTVMFIDGDNQDKVLNIQYVKRGYRAIEPNVMTHKDYVRNVHRIFDKWIYKDTGQDYEFEAVNSDLQILAVFKDAFEVEFKDSFDGRVLSKQIVGQNDSAIAPQYPMHRTYVGIGWDRDFSHITEPLVVTPIFIDVEKLITYEINKKTIQNLKDVNAIKNSLTNIFTWLPGERILNPEFGSNLRKLLYEGITDYNVEKIIAEIRQCVSEWEPRVQIQNVINVSSVDDVEDNTVHLEVIFTIIGLSETQYSHKIEYKKSLL